MQNEERGVVLEESKMADKKKESKSERAIKLVFAVSAIIFLNGIIGIIITIRAGSSSNPSGFFTAMLAGVLGMAIYGALKSLKVDCLDNKNGEQGAPVDVDKPRR